MGNKQSIHELKSGRTDRNDTSVDCQLFPAVTNYICKYGFYKIKHNNIDYVLELFDIPKAKRTNVDIHFNQIKNNGKIEYIAMPFICRKMDKKTWKVSCLNRSFS